MALISISHNPYLIKTIIAVESEEIIGGPLYELVVGKRLQMWLEKIFPQLIDFCNCRKLDVSFKGTVADFNDIELTAKAYSNESGISIKLIHLAGGEADPAKKITALKELFEEAKNGPIEEFHDEEIDRAFNSALDSDFVVSVIATMSAGKSTLINAIIGEDLLPAKNEACTATLTYISDDDQKDHFIGRAFDENNDAQTDWVRVTPELLEEWNVAHIARVEMQGNIRMIRSAENARLVLADTPGPNNSRSDSHNRCTMGMIKNDTQKPMILYVLNAQQLSTNDDHILLSAVAKEMSKGGKQSHDRFIFAVNKIDELDPEKESIPGALKNVRAYLEDHGIQNPNIYPVSALVSKLIRIKLKGHELSRHERNELRGKTELFVEDEAMHLLQYMPVSTTVKREILKRIAEAERVADQDELAMLHSGVPVIEECIQEYLRKYALPAKLYDAKASFEIILERRETLTHIDDELRKSASERESIHEEMRKIQGRIKQGEEAGAFNARLKNMQWKKSKEYDACIRPLEISIAKKINQLQDKVGNEEVSPAIAQTILRGIEQDASMTTIDLQQELEKAVKREALTVMDQIRKDYQEYVKDLLGGAENVSLAMKEFKSAAIMLPTSETLIKKYVETRRVVIGSHYESNSSFWKPWTWFSKKEVNDYENREVVKMFELAQDIANDLRKNFFLNFETAEKLTSEMVSEIRDAFMSEMEGMDTKIQQMVDEMANKTESYDSLEKSIRENDEKRDWLNKFQLRLDTVLSINGTDDVELPDKQPPVSHSRRTMKGDSR